MCVRKSQTVLTGDAGAHGGQDKKRARHAKRSRNSERDVSNRRAA
jgi:hypothetical protein